MDELDKFICGLIKWMIKNARNFYDKLFLVQTFKIIDVKI